MWYMNARLGFRLKMPKSGSHVVTVMLFLKLSKLLDKTTHAEEGWEKDATFNS